ncbi:MAG: zinc-dependent metalloprotease family protein [Chitinophagaceae bacterium]
MRKISKFSLFTLLLITLTNAVLAQNRFFQDAGENKSILTSGERVIMPKEFRTSTMNVQAMKSFLWTLPSENSILNNKSNTPVISLPMPDGSMARFHVWESNIMEPALASKFPAMKQFLGQGIDDPYATIRFDYNPYTGFHGQILSAKTGRIFIDPFANGDVNNYISYFARNAVSPAQFICNVEENLSMDYPNPVANRTEAACLGTTLRTYRLALACTGEYAVAVNGPVPTTGGVAAAMLTAVNRVTGVYENEVAVRLQIVANNNFLIYLDGTTDPYTNNNGLTMLGENQTNIDAVIGSANYDIGHVFSTAGGGIAALGVICSNGNKGRGVTGLPNPLGDAFYIDFVAHEMGHQFGGSHTFNGVSSNCGGNSRNATTAYEVGSGTTIMSYAGICGSDNIQNNSDPFFHAISFDEISNRINTTSCAAITVTGNTLPVIAPLANNNLTIPVNTPFTLSGTATDANGDPLTYCWEEMDLGPGGAWNDGATSTTAPLFKSRVPKTTGVRTFPDMAVILAGYPSNPASTLGGLKGETLPIVERVMKFRLTVRDNRAGGGGVVSSGTLGCQTSTSFVVNVAGATPFIVTYPNGSENLLGGSTQIITWDNAGTSAAPFNVANVKISLSIDGGLTYPTILAVSTPNDGSEAVPFPCIATNTNARIRIEALGNIFFDISNSNFTIQSGFSFSNPSPAISSCPVPTSMSIVLGSSACNLANPISLSASGNPAGTSVSFSQNPVAGGSNVTVTLNGTNILAGGDYTIIVTGTSAGSPTQVRNLVYTISIPASPIITTHPSNSTICVGGNATFLVTATGAASYQWQISTNGGGIYSDIAGAISSSYTATGVTAAMNGYLYRSVVGAICAAPSISNAATLTVISPVIISSQPTDKIICSGSNTSFTVTGNSTQPINYQWQISTNGGSSYVDIPNGGIYSGATTSTLNITGALTSMNSYLYRSKLSNAACTTPTISAAALLTVRQLPTVTLTASPLTSLLPGQITTLTATPSASIGGVITTNWVYNGTPLPAITGNTYVVNIETTGSYQVFIQETFSSPSLVCSNQSALVIIDAIESSKLFIFPSPNDGRFTVSYFNSDGTSTKRKIAIYDSKGSSVYNAEFAISGRYTLLNINLEKAARGLYFVVIGDATGKKLAEGKVHVR